MKKEIEKGQKYLLQMLTLREECAKLSFKSEINENKRLNKRGIETQSFHFESKYDSKGIFDKFRNLIYVILTNSFFRKV